MPFQVSAEKAKASYLLIKVSHNSSTEQAKEIPTQRNLSAFPAAPADWCLSSALSQHRQQNNSGRLHTKIRTRTRPAGMHAATDGDPKVTPPRLS